MRSDAGRQKVQHCGRVSPIVRPCHTKFHTDVDNRLASISSPPWICSPTILATTIPVIEHFWMQLIFHRSVWSNHVSMCTLLMWMKTAVIHCCYYLEWTQLLNRLVVGSRLCRWRLQLLLCCLIWQNLLAFSRLNDAFRVERHFWLQRHFWLH